MPPASKQKRTVKDDFKSAFHLLIVVSKSMDMYSSVTSDGVLFNTTPHFDMRLENFCWILEDLCPKCWSTLKHRNKEVVIDHNVIKITVLFLKQ